MLVSLWQELDLEPVKVRLLTEGESTCCSGSALQSASTSLFLGSVTNAALVFGSSMAQTPLLDCKRGVLPAPSQSGSVQGENKKGNMEPQAEQNPSKIGLPLATRHHLDPFTLLEPTDDSPSGGLKTDLNISRSMPPPASTGQRIPAGLTSRGSALHAIGTCQPCAWFWKQGGCQNGKDCLRCHSCQPGEVKLRKKVKRTLMHNGHMSSSLQAPALMPNKLERTAAAHTVQNLSSTYSSEVSEGGKIVPLSIAFTGEEKDPELPVWKTGSLQAPPGLELPHKTETVSSSCTNSMSTGSFLHETGACQPCAWFWKAGGCQNGKDCVRCHTCPPGEVKARKKAKRALIRLGLVTPGAKAE